MPPLGSILIGAAVGAGVSWARGGDPLKGALYGAIGGGIGGAAAPGIAGIPTGFSVGAAPAVGGVIGGAAGPTVGSKVSGMLHAPSRGGVIRPSKISSTPTRMADVKRRGIDALSARLKKARSRAASRVLLPSQISELATMQRPILSDILG